ncbi:Asp23/Gls24 family envelope stress response protein [Subtercola boreus]|uniref:Asp23/Gls24 family envelope stress response protein n=1 Tax=Subtercola boreus TaxID=120213 RepID=A0A3E0WGT5_9MICO|nr:Asp23/Gls24 family envelope stress response protein [Subtercola boreus]RFA23678.1 hypothetical protein B7R24_00075 [Subtercola boreus]RFA24070.1 hypothetical protein B7R23_00075 [Subtercola boreus]RFA29771.1 hypothetical protein B7R25_00070 [Subtercola boreus]
MSDEIALEGFEPADLDGHTIDELSDYLEAGCLPFDPSIESSPGCQIAMAALIRLRGVSLSLLETEAIDEPARDDSWVAGILNRIGFEAQAGRSIPVSHPSAQAFLTLTEGAVRGLIRAAGDSVTGVLIGRCRLQGDVTVPGEPITVLVDASVFWGESIPEAAARVREAIYAELLKHTELTIAAIDVVIHDVHLSRSLGEDAAEEIE